MKRRDFLQGGVSLGALLTSGCWLGNGKDWVKPIPKRTVSYVGLPDFWFPSTNGRFAAFLALPTDASDESRTQVQVFNTKTREVWVCSVGHDGYCDGEVDAPSLSASGQVVAFQATAGNLVPGPPDRFWQLYVAEREGGVRRISSSPSGELGNGTSFDPYVSADARTITFLTKATNLTRPALDTPERHVVAWSRASGTITLVSAAADGTPANGPCSEAMVGRNGRFVTFSSSATNLGGPPNNKGLSQIYVRDLETGTLKWVSRGDTAECPCSVPRASAGARFVTYEVSTDDGRAIYLWDDENATVTKVSPSHYAERNDFRNPYITGDGRFISFLVPSSESECDVLIYDHEARTTLRVATQASFVRHHLPRVLRDGSAVWLVADPASVGEEVPADGETPLPSEDAREVIAIANPFL